MAWLTHTVIAIRAKMGVIECSIHTVTEQVHDQNFQYYHYQTDSIGHMVSMLTCPGETCDCVCALGGHAFLHHLFHD